LDYIKEYVLKQAPLQAMDIFTLPQRTDSNAGCFESAHCSYSHDHCGDVMINVPVPEHLYIRCGGLYCKGQTRRADFVRVVFNHHKWWFDSHFDVMEDYLERSSKDLRHRMLVDLDTCFYVFSHTNVRCVHCLIK